MAVKNIHKKPSSNLVHLYSFNNNIFSIDI